MSRDSMSLELCRMWILHEATFQPSLHLVCDVSFVLLLIFDTWLSLLFSQSITYQCIRLARDWPRSETC